MKKVARFKANNGRPHRATSQVLSNPLVARQFNGGTLNGGAKWAQTSTKKNPNKQILYSAAVVCLCWMLFDTHGLKCQAAHQWVVLAFFKTHTSQMCVQLSEARIVCLHAGLCCCCRAYRFVACAAALRNVSPCRYNQYSETDVAGCDTHTVVLWRKWSGNMRSETNKNVITFACRSQRRRLIHCWAFIWIERPQLMV